MFNAVRVAVLLTVLGLCVAATIRECRALWRDLKACV